MNHFPGSFKTHHNGFALVFSMALGSVPKAALLKISLLFLEDCVLSSLTGSKTDSKPAFHDERTGRLASIIPS